MRTALLLFLWCILLSATVDAVEDEQVRVIIEKEMPGPISDLVLFYRHHAECPYSQEVVFCGTLWSCEIIMARRKLSCIKEIIPLLGNSSFGCGEYSPAGADEIVEDMSVFIITIPAVFKAKD